MNKSKFIYYVDNHECTCTQCAYYIGLASINFAIGLAKKEGWYENNKKYYKREMKNREAIIKRGTKPLLALRNSMSYAIVSVEADFYQFQEKGGVHVKIERRQP